MQCAACHLHACAEGTNCTEQSQGAVVASYGAEDRRVLEAASVCTDSDHYMKLSRLEEAVCFAKSMGARRVGIAFCIAMAREALQIEELFTRDFEVHSVCCKVCGIDKGAMGLADAKPGRFAAMCNPKTQAALLKESRTDVNFSVGLCIGHDALFTRHSHAPCSCLIVKDRVLNHNPIAALRAKD
ncbi:MAG TPA: DUF1847 domain-containing protein [Holophaga sp.]|jgi:uncharacterized metal-binding protein|nr:DUF1847 domain-containing protein [Holophaga sp.]